MDKPITFTEILAAMADAQRAQAAADALIEKFSAQEVTGSHFESGPGYPNLACTCKLGADHTFAEFVALADLA